MSGGGWRSGFGRRSLGGAGVRVVGIAKNVGALPAVLLICLCMLGAFLVLGAVVSLANPKIGGGSVVCRVAGGGAESPPAKLLPIYQGATERYKLGPRGPSILAAINFRETSFGTNMNNTSGSGAMGWMMFMPETWSAYGVDANGDGAKDPYNPWDAIFAAARYLRASGAPGNWHDAIFAYNHAEWYVQDVLEAAQTFDGSVVCVDAPVEGLGELPSDALQRVEYVARWIESQRIHYCWGGGHGVKPGPDPGEYCWNSAGTEKVFGSGLDGLDCSGAVRWLLTISGFDDPGGIASGSFASAYEPGPGRAVTIWSNAEHVFIVINGRAWGTSSSNFAHGPGYAEHTTEGFAASHPPGL